MQGRSLFHSKAVHKQCRALLWDLLLHLIAPVSQVSLGRRFFPHALAEEHGVTADRRETRCHCRAKLTPSLLAPVTEEPASVSELEANKAKGKIILFFTQNSSCLILRLQAQLLPITHVSPIKPDSYQHQHASHFRCNLTLCCGSLRLYYGKSERLPWSFFHISEGKEQKIPQVVSDKTACCQQCYSFSRISTVKFTYSLFQHRSAASQLSFATLTSWNIQDWCEKFLYQNPPSGEEIISCFSSGHWNGLKDQLQT